MFEQPFYSFAGMILNLRFVSLVGLRAGFSF